MAIILDGIDQHARALSVIAGSVNAQDPQAFYGRVKIPAGSAGFEAVMGAGDAGSPFAFQLYKNDDGAGAVQLAARLWTTSAETTAYTTATADTWLPVLITSTGTSIAIYIGEGTTTPNATLAVSPSSGALDDIRIGARETSTVFAENFFEGSIAVCRYWSRVPTAGEISTLMNATSVADVDSVSATGLVHSENFIDTAGAAYTLYGATAPAIDSDTSFGSATPVVRKSSQFTVETTLSGTITAATLNGNAITVDSQVGTTVTLTDSGSGITTSGEYNLVLTNDAATPENETIVVQVNVVGLPSNTARKDGGLLVSLSDLTLDAVNVSGTVVKQLTGITTDASGIISPVDLSDISEAVGDTLKVSLHSAASDVGVTFEQALELI